MSRVYAGLARAVAALAVLSLGLTGYAHDWAVHETRASGPLDATALTNNAGDGLGWLVGFVLTPLCALALVVLAVVIRERPRLTAALLVAGLALLAAVLGEAGRSMPLLGAAHALAVVALGVVAWQAAARVADVRTVTATPR